MTEENADTITAPPATETPPPAAETPPAETVPDWSPDWRVKLAGGDEKRAKAYEKYATPKDVADAHLSLQQQLSSGEYVKRLPKDAKPEQIAEWRKNNGIPESPEKYDFNLPDGLVMGEADLNVARKFATDLHGENLTQKQLQSTVTWWMKAQQEALQQRQQEDVETRKATEDALRAAWGGEYRMNEAAISNVLAGMPEELSTTIQQARGPDGKLLWDNPAFRSHMLNQALLENPARTLIPGGEGNSLDNINQQLAEIKKVQQEDPHRYYKDTALQEKRMKLLTAQQTLANRKTA